MAERDIHMDFAAVFRLAMKDTDSQVRAVAIDGLWESEDVRLVPQLAESLTEDQAEEVRVAAAQCLAHFVLLGELQKIRPEPFDTACRALLGRLDEADEESLEVRRRALESIAYAGLDEVEDLIWAAYGHPEELMRISAVFAMGRSADGQWIKQVMNNLHHPNPAMRYEAARAAGELSAEEAVPDLVELTEDVDVEVQQAALGALGQIGGSQARRTLQRYVTSDDEAVREAARAALRELEFFHGDIDRFFGPPEDFSGEGGEPWSLNEDPYELEDDVGSDPWEG
jgi:HEAT repeat protein